MADIHTELVIEEMEKPDKKLPVIKDLYSKDREKICPELNKSNFTGKELWYQSYKHCLNKCKKCKELEILKKILWELRKPK